ncbi:glycine-rich protein A3-like isoform X1 [Pyrus x bretschneideri]|uniref:glycine-rich protein A3-like isoform X1 n=2 Tax=Pyrus x bretschneideri TaxID=225117 RepID=UPI00202E99B0|nr:glycine-rich protein A3-like isoform X1 [Pyrus x bretschneideri]
MLCSFNHELSGAFHLDQSYLLDKMGGGKHEKHETTEKALFSYPASGYGSYPPQGYGSYPPQVYGSYPPQGYGYPPQAHHAYPSSGGYPPAAYPSYWGYPPTGYPGPGYGAAGIEMGGMLAGGAVTGVPAYGCGAYHGYGGSHGYGGAAGYDHGKFRHGSLANHLRASSTNGIKTYNMVDLRQISWSLHQDPNPV